MRELKFRAWLKNYNSYAEVLGFDWGMLIVHLQRGELVEHRLHVPLEDCILEQYICLEDKNGKEIYEGDIIKQTWFNGDDGDIIVTGVVGFDEDEASFDIVQTISTTNRQYSGFYSQREVIGNIHENANLLKEEK